MPRRDRRLTPTGKEERKQLSQVTQSDIARAQMAWRELAPVQYKELLDAVNDPQLEE